MAPSVLIVVVVVLVVLLLVRRRVPVSWGFGPPGVEISGAIGRTTIPWSQIVSIRVVGSETVNERVTVPRLAMFGIFAFAMKKPTGPGVMVALEFNGHPSMKLYTYTLTAQAVRAWIEQTPPGELNPAEPLT